MRQEPGGCFCFVRRVIRRRVVVAVVRPVSVEGGKYQGWPVPHRLAAEANIPIRSDEVQRLRSGTVGGVQFLPWVEQDVTVPVERLWLLVGAHNNARFDIGS